MTAWLCLLPPERSRVVLLTVAAVGPLPRPSKGAAEAGSCPVAQQPVRVAERHPPR